MTAAMADLLSAAGLLVGLAGLLFGVWYPEIEAARAVIIPKHTADAGPQRSQVRHALNQRAMPLAVVTTGLTLVLLPDALRIIVEPFRFWWLNAEMSYDAVKACFVLVETIAAGLAVSSAAAVIDLRRIKRSLKE